MREFFETSLKCQQAALQLASSTTSMVLQMQQRFYEQQLALLTHAHAHRRSNEPEDEPKVPKAKKKRKGRGAKSPCHGPDLMDHYGKRSHDVDVEHSI